uniref:Uncharacterized protein n=1 Tax=Arundo donax TaxID=35708 RepID=A0A0A9D5J1_ARUDO
MSYHEKLEDGQTTCALKFSPFSDKALLFRMPKERGEKKGWVVCSGGHLSARCWTASAAGGREKASIIFWFPIMARLEHHCQNLTPI